MRAIDDVGPQISMREIAAEAGIPKPTLYRFFTDKSELVASIRDQAMDELSRSVTLDQQRPLRTVGEILQAGMRGYAKYAYDHPSIIRFLLLNLSVGAETGIPMCNAFACSHTVAGNMANILAAITETSDESATADIPTSAMIVGAVIFATDMWIGDGHPSQSPDWFAHRVTSIIGAMVQATADADSAAIDINAEIPAVVAAAIDLNTGGASQVQ